MCPVLYDYYNTTDEQSGYGQSESGGEIPDCETRCRATAYRLYEIELKIAGPYGLRLHIAKDSRTESRQD